LGDPFGVGEEVDLDDLAVPDGEAAIENGRPWRNVTIPAAPLTSARRMVRSTRDQSTAWPATASAPCTCVDRPVRPPSARSTTSRSSTATSASKSPFRATARNASGRGTADAAARTARELARRLGRALDDRRDLLERDGEHVVQDEGQSLGRGPPSDDKCVEAADYALGRVRVAD
jgi:hypothetical protein